MININSIKNIYKRYALFYDLLFGRFLQQGRLASTNLVNHYARYGARVLEVGVGTGLSLPYYRNDLEITGIDVCEEMLAKARKRLSIANLKTKIDLLEMDAENLQFEEQSFDFVVAMHVASVVPHIDDFLREICRVTKKGGEIIIVNHFASDNSFISAIEKKLTKLHAFVGFQAGLSLNKILQYPSFKLINSYRTNFLGHSRVLHLQNRSTSPIRE